MKFPDIPEQYRGDFPDFFWDWWRSLRTFIRRGFTTAGDITLLTADAGVILVSPNGTKYKVTVDDGGTLQVNAV